MNSIVTATKKNVLNPSLIYEAKEMLSGASQFESSCKTEDVIPAERPENLMFGSRNKRMKGKQFKIGICDSIRINQN